MKSLTVLISGAPQGDNLKDLEIESGTTAGDVLRALNLRGFLLSRAESAQAFSEEECIWHHVNEGDKLRATPIAEVGAIHWLLKILGLVSVDRKASRARQRKPRVDGTASAITRVRTSLPKPSSGSRHVQRDRRPLWEMRGWRTDGSRLAGAYRTPRGSYCGEIELSNGRPEFYIRNPPAGLLKAPPQGLFSETGEESFLYTLWH